MRKLLIILVIFVVGAAALSAQTRPDLQPVITDPQDTDALYTQERGALNKIFLNVLRAYYAAEVQDTVKAYTPGVGVIPQNDFVSIITAADSNLYYIDGAGDYVQLSGGPVNWDDIINTPSNVVNAISSVTSDATLSGLGTISTPLSVDTTLIASREYLANELDDRIEVYKTIVASGNTTSLSIDFLPDTRYPILLFVNGILWSQDAAADFTLTGSTLNLNTTLFAGWRTTVQYTKLQ